MYQMFQVLTLLRQKPAIASLDCESLMCFGPKVIIFVDHLHLCLSVPVYDFWDTSGPGPIHRALSSAGTELLVSKVR